MTVWAFTVTVQMVFGVAHPIDTLWYPTAAACEAARLGAEQMMKAEGRASRVSQCQEHRRVPTSATARTGAPRPAMP
jgi:hypothetical protein